MGPYRQLTERVEVGNKTVSESELSDYLFSGSESVAPPFE